MISFSSDHFEENKFREEDLIRLFAYGFSLNMDPTRPTLILRDEKNELSLPVALSPIEAGIAIGQSNQRTPMSSPHHMLKLLLESLSIRIERCVFVEIKGVHQFVRIFFDGHPTHGSLKVRAEEAMSLCLHLNVPIFATKKLVQKSRNLSAGVGAELNNEIQAQLNNAILGQIVQSRSNDYLN